MDTKPQNSTIINVCVIPSVEAGNKCVQLSQLLKSDGTMFVLDGKSKFAHMTVFMFRVKDSKIESVIEAVDKILENQKSFLCNQASPGFFMTKGRYYEVSYQKTPEFVALHENLVKALSPIRINPGNPFEEGYFTPYTEEQQKNAKETGYDLALNLFRPHVTLTRYFEGKVPETEPDLPVANLSFQLGKVCVFKADDNGAVYEKLAEFEAMQ